MSSTCLGGPSLFHVPWDGSSNFFGPAVCKLSLSPMCLAGVLAGQRVETWGIERASCTRLGGFSTCGSIISILALWGRADYGVFGKLFKSLSISTICVLKRFKSVRIYMFFGEVGVTDFVFVGGSILVEVDFCIGDSSHATMVGARYVGEDGIRWRGRVGCEEC